MEKFIPVVVIKELGETDKILTALKNNGIHCAEITFRTACAAEAIAYAVKQYPDMEIGAGTVINAEQCEAALAAGATFIVSPGLSVAVANICRDRNIPYYPGCVTPTEIMQALELGHYHRQILPGQRVWRPESPESSVRSVPAGEIHSHRRRRSLQHR